MGWVATGARSQRSPWEGAPPRIGTRHGGTRMLKDSRLGEHRASFWDTVLRDRTALRFACMGDRGRIINVKPRLRMSGAASESKRERAFFGCKTVAAFAHVSLSLSQVSAFEERETKGEHRDLRIRYCRCQHRARPRRPPPPPAGYISASASPLCASIDFSIASDRRKIPEETKSEAEEALASVVSTSTQLAACCIIDPASCIALIDLARALTSKLCVAAAHLRQVHLGLS